MFLASARANARISIARLRANIEPLCGISIAPRAQISTYIISPHPPSPRRRSPAPRRSRPLFVTPKACHLSRYREILPHKARQSRAGEGRWVKKPSNNFQLSVFNFQFEMSEGVECGRLTQQAKTARRRVLYVRNCVTFKHVASRCRAIRSQDCLAPHSGQNLAPGAISAPQFAQNFLEGIFSPHSGQNLAVAEIAAPHLGQTLVAPAAAAPTAAPAAAPATAAPLGAGFCG